MVDSSDKTTRKVRRAGVVAGLGLVPSLNVCTAPAKSGVAPMNAADLYSSVVPVLPIIGRVHLTARAAAAAVPRSWSSLLMPAARPFASPSATTCSHGASFTGTPLPLRSSTLPIGVGGHHLPPLTMVAATFASSRVDTGAGDSVNDALPPFCLKNSVCEIRFCLSLAFGSLALRSGW